MIINRVPERICEIDDQLLPYDICADEDTPLGLRESPVDLMYIGKGQIWSIDGFLQKGNKIYHFYRFGVKK